MPTVGYRDLPTYLELLLVFKRLCLADLVQEVHLPLFPTRPGTSKVRQRLLHRLFQMKALPLPEPSVIVSLHHLPISAWPREQQGLPEMELV